MNMIIKYVQHVKLNAKIASAVLEFENVTDM